MSRIVKCHFCGHISETFRPTHRMCNHNQEELGHPNPTATMFPVEPILEAFVQGHIVYHETKLKARLDKNNLHLEVERQAISGQCKMVHSLGFLVPEEGTANRFLWNKADAIAKRIVGIVDELGS